MVIISQATARTATVNLNRQLLDKHNRIRLLPAAFYNTLDPLELRAWLHVQARYFIPTVESVALIKQLINGHKAIEIGSGNGDLYFLPGHPWHRRLPASQPSRQSVLRTDWPAHDQAT